jgi:hypothetical protein
VDEEYFTQHTRVMRSVVVTPTHEYDGDVHWIWLGPPGRIGEARAFVLGEEIPVGFRPETSCDIRWCVRPWHVTVEPSSDTWSLV